MKPKKRVSLAFEILEGRDLPASAKGIQAVYFGDWSTKSRENLIKVITAPNAPAVEVAQAITPQLGLSSFHNTKKLVEALVAAGKPVVLTFQLGFHDSGDANPGSDLYERLKKTAGRLSDFLTNTTVNGTSLIRLQNLKLTVSPSLEDLFVNSSQFKKAAQAVVDGLSLEVFLKANIRWINTKKGSVTNYDDASVTDLTFSKAGATYSKALQHEYHGKAANAQGYGFFSNDGSFVRSNGDMDGDRVTDEYFKASVNPDDNDRVKRNNYLTLDEFKSSIKRYNGVALLWRPSYNLHNRQAGPGFNILGYDKGPLKGRSDSDRAPAFNSLEKAILQRYLGI